ncbi:response regulator [Streptomyces ipomoeae]|uniref:Response regulator receiver domain protein n=1 Tax=Streptomyces ipomoeae 91-03 TaxID=698759 RepID=L1KX69_9ACTN|nr:response regulator transcription factor [Streptomyces ipomoeae]EKX65202.1 response regulator receiver domain protein [Streptomyces ipomoeae 91-03]MDX2692419.1 response regulator transcription factor [Streptomyces ipomoeae]MDX2838057.1 response regulator transcription factor [Streptomyces ipomoeae]TQE39795.1 response regulator transcription factor [Streptomyces ipomoeae]
MTAPVNPISPISPIRTLIVDDEWMVRSMLRTIMEAAPDITVTGEASDGVEAVDLARTLQPDVVLMDIRMPRGDGLTATERMTRLDPPPYVVVLTTFDLDEYVHTALRNGAVGFLLKDASADDMLAAVRSAARGDAMISPRITRRLLRKFAEPVPARRSDAEQRLAALTDKEREVLVAVGGGLSNTEIAATLYMSEATAKTHVSRILTKLDLANRVQAAILAHQAGLLD